VNERIRIVQGDITTLKVDAIVNAAQNSLVRGGGVDGAIHRAAGPQLQQECLTLGGCETGNAKASRGYDLPAKYVIHTVGPVWRPRHLEGTEDELLACCYRRSLEVAHDLGINSIAFPAISTGIYGFPAERAAKIAIREVQDHAQSFEVVFVCFDSETYALYSRLLATDRKELR
jgi:O-acetyl-ADP-ribose deacetylase (regulator of RNase III)